MRRCWTVRAASPGLVLRGEARFLAAAATRGRSYTAVELAQADPQRRKQLHERLEKLEQRPGVYGESDHVVGGA